MPHQLFKGGVRRTDTQFRGFDATQRRVEYYTTDPDVKLRVASKIRLWYPEDIDAFGAYLEQQGALTHSAMWRKEHGLTYEQEQEVLANVDRQEFADAVKDDFICVADEKRLIEKAKQKVAAKKEGKK